MWNRSSSGSRQLFKTPFCRAYWAQAFREFKDLRMLLFAALIIAIRVALKAVRIPIAASLDINTAFIANALGAAVYGPVVALVGGAISDTLGCIFAPNGPYFFPFIFVEMASSLVFALFLYRTEISILRLTLARFCICFFVNIILSEPIMVLYYQAFFSKAYAPFELIRIAKNLVMFPLEALVLAILFRGLIPPFQRLGYLFGDTKKLRFTRRHIAVLAALFLAGSLATAGYAVYDYNTKSFSASYSAQERLEKNKAMNAWVAEENPQLDGDALVTVIESARSKVLQKEMTYELAVYRIDRAAFDAAAEEAKASGGVYTLDTLHGYSKSKAAKDAVLSRIGSGTAVTDKHTGDRLSLCIQWLDESK